MPRAILLAEVKKTGFKNTKIKKYAKTKYILAERQGEYAPYQRSCTPTFYKRMAPE